MMKRSRKYRGCTTSLLALVALYLMEGMNVSFRSSIFRTIGDNKPTAIRKDLTSTPCSIDEGTSDMTTIHSGDEVTIQSTDEAATIDMSDPNWWEPFVDQIARPFSIRPDKSWCVPRTISNVTSLREKNIQSGMYLVKIEKTASSTVAGVSIQIARHVGQQQHNDESTECTYHAAHGSEYIHRQDPFFLWTVLRHPSKRAISHYYFIEVSRKKIHPTPSHMIRKMNDHKSHQLRAISPQFATDPRHASAANNASEIVQILRDTVSNFHFVGLSDRMDETLVALKHILQVDLQDVVVLSSKRNGGLDDGRFKNTCFKIQPANITSQVETYLREDFPVHNHDFFLYAVANRSLDLTIDAIGRERFQHDLDTFRAMSQYAQEKCLDKAVFPCVTEGLPPLPEANKSCYFGDIGCGHVCVREVLQEFTV